MTHLNWYNPWPDEAVVKCKRCGKPAVFRVAYSVVDASGWPSWEPRLWPCARATDWSRTHEWIPGDPRPDWRGWIIIEHDPAIHRWVQPPKGFRGTDDGIVLCPTCGDRRSHTLRWPDDAWYRFDLPEGVLWAWSRFHVDALIDFIESVDRDAAAHGPYYLFLCHVPAAFLAAKHRLDTGKCIRRAVARLDEV